MIASRPTLARRDAICVLVVGLTALALYIATLQPDFGGPEDTPKFQFVGHVLGTPHPPGYPLYVLLSHVFVKLPVGTIAYRANLFSAVLAALACALAYVIGRQIGASRQAAFFTALGLATGASFWRSAVFAEVYSLAAVMAGLTVTLLLAWGTRGGAVRLLAAVSTFGLALGNHLTVIGLLPAFALYVLRRDRRALTARVVVAGMLVTLVGISQYGFIIVRSRQGAPYLESRASSLSELVDIVTAKRFADQRFAFGPSVLLTVQVPAVASVCHRELGTAGVLLLVTGLIAAVRRRSAEAGLVIGGAAGMLAMVMNLSGDLAGFITPVTVFLWPLTALGVSAIVQFLQSRRTAGPVLGTVALLTTAAMPLANLAANYSNADQSGEYAAARFLRRVYAQLPDRAGVVVEDYWNAMALQYFTLTAGRGKWIARVEFAGADVRRAAQDGRRVFAFAGAATVLGAEGLQFERAVVTGPPLDEWLRDLPRGSVVVGATAYAAAPFDPATLGHSNARRIGRPRSFEAFVLIARKPGAAWRADDKPISFAVEPDPPGFTPSVPFAGPLLASADVNGARIDLAGRTIAQVDAGLALAVFAGDGTLLRGLELPAGEAPRVPFQEALYELTAETPCVNLITETWTDLGPVLSTGSWVASFSDVGSVVIESAFRQSPGVRARSSVLLGDGETRTVESATGEDTVLFTELTRTAWRRPVFRLALNRAPAAARGRVKPGGVRSFVIVCQHRPVRPLFQAGVEAAGNIAVLRPDFESEAYFGAGWGAAERTATGPVRRGDDTATLLLPFDTSFTYRVALDVTAGDSGIDIAANGAAAGSCELSHKIPCEVTLGPGVVRQGTNALTLSVRRGGASALRREPLTFRGARIIRRFAEVSHNR